MENDFTSSEALRYAEGRRHGDLKVMYTFIRQLEAAFDGVSPSTALAVDYEDCFPKGMLCNRSTLKNKHRPRKYIQGWVRFRLHPCGVQAIV